MLFIVLWVIGAVISWIGAVIYGKHITMLTWEEMFRYIRENSESSTKETLKCLLFLVAWPIEIWGLIYCAVQISKLRFMEEES